MRDDATTWPGVGWICSYIGSIKVSRRGASTDPGIGCAWVSEGPSSQPFGALDFPLLAFSSCSLSLWQAVIRIWAPLSHLTSSAHRLYPCLFCKVVLLPLWRQVGGAPTGPRIAQSQAIWTRCSPRIYGSSIEMPEFNSLEAECPNSTLTPHPRLGHGLPACRGITITDVRLDRSHDRFHKIQPSARHHSERTCC